MYSESLVETGRTNVESWNSSDHCFAIFTAIPHPQHTCYIHVFTMDIYLHISRYSSARGILCIPSQSTVLLRDYPCQAHPSPPVRGVGGAKWSNWYNASCPGWGFQLVCSVVLGQAHQFFPIRANVSFSISLFETYLPALHIQVFLQKFFPSFPLLSRRDWIAEVNMA